MPSINPSFENLPAEVTVNILSRLPVKTIIHCKCVCRKWQNLVIDSYFINLHFSRSPAGLIVYNDVNILDNATSGILKWVEIEDKLDHHRLHHDPIMNFDLNRYLAAPIPFTHMMPVGSVNGLICISQRGVNVDNIYICNPITREYLMLPNPRQGYDKDGLGIIVYSFGVSSLTREYKVLRTFQGDVPPFYLSVLEAQVYTLGTGQWRSLGRVPYQFGGFGGPFLNGHFHWMLYDEDAPEKIFTFNLDEETFQLFPSPPTESEAIQGSMIRWQRLGVLKGCLCKSYTCGFQFKIWVMKEYGIKKSWHKEVVINQAICPNLDWSMRQSIILVEGLKDGSILMVQGSKLFAYCPRSQTIEDVEILGSWLIVLAHRPSLFKLQSFESEGVHTF